MGKRKPLMVWGALATLAIVLPLFLEIQLSPAWLGLLFFGLGFFTSTQVITYPLIAESNPASNTGSATGIASVIIMGGGGVGQVLFGSLMHAHSTTVEYTSHDFQYAMWMFPIATIIALLAMMRIKETNCRASS